MFYINEETEFKARFDMAAFMEYRTDGYDVLDSYLIIELMKLPVGGNITVSDETSIRFYDVNELVEFNLLEVQRIAESFGLSSSGSKWEVIQRIFEFNKTMSLGGRLDLISYRVYGDTSFWWILMIYNNLPSVAELRPGMVLRFPLRSALENLYFRLRALSSQ